MLVGSAVMGPRTPEHLTELEAFFNDAPKPVGAGERCEVYELTFWSWLPLNPWSLRLANPFGEWTLLLLSL